MYGQIRRAVASALRHQLTDRAAAVAFYAFLALPALLLVAVGAFAAVGGADAVNTIISRVETVVPAEAASLLREGLLRTTREGGAAALVGVGGVLALWTATGAMTALMRALNAVYDRSETRSFVRQRLVALVLILLMSAAFLIVFGLLVLGPHLSGWIGDATGLGDALAWIWWAGQWPVVIGGLLVAFATVLRVAPDLDRPRWSLLTPGAFVALVVWLAGSAGFAVYVANFGSYNATWGSLAAVIVMLTWLWLSFVAILFGAEVNAEGERSRSAPRAVEPVSPSTPPGNESA